MSDKNKEGTAGILLIFAVLCNSIPVFAQGFTNSSMGAIYAAFPDVNVTLTKMIVSVPSLMQLFFPLVTAFLEQFMKRRKIMAIAFGLATIGGILPAFFGSSIYFIIISRAIFGAGMGMIAPFAMGLVGNFFEGELRAKVLGWRITFSNIMQILFNFFGGIVSNFGWRNSFLGYFILVPIAIFVLVVLPDAPPIRKAAEKEKKTRVALPWFVFLMIFANLLFRCLYQTVNTNLGIVVRANNIGTGTLTGTVFAVTNAAAIVFGILYGLVPKGVRKYSTAFGMIVLGIALFIWSETSLPGMYILGGVLVAIGFNCFGVNYTNMVMDVCNKELATTVMAISTSAAGLSQFLSPIILDFLANVFKYEGVTGPWKLSATVLLPWGIIMFVVIFMIYRNIVEKNAPGTGIILKGQEQ
jgi:MFS family permease